MTTKTIILGGGGHASVLVEALRLSGKNISGYTAPTSDRNAIKAGVKYLGLDEEILNHPSTNTLLINGIGSTGTPVLRRDLFEHFRNLGYEFDNVFHPTASLSQSIKFENGLQALAGSIINPHGKFGNNVLINTGAIVEHHCNVGNHVHIAPGAIISGDVRIGNSVHVGAGAIILQGLTIGNEAVIAAGSVVTHSVPDFALAAGNPASIKKMYF